MSKTGGAREGAGRKAGSLSRKSVEVLSAALDAGTTPVEFMLDILRDDKADAKDRQWAAEKAAPFSLIAVIEARRKAIETEDLLQRIEKLETLQPAGRV